MWLADVTASNSPNKAWSSVIQRSADAGAEATPTMGMADWSVGRLGAVLIAANSSSRLVEVASPQSLRRCARCMFRPGKSRSHRDFGQNSAEMRRWGGSCNCHPNSVVGRVWGKGGVPYVDGLQPRGEFDSRAARHLVYLVQLARWTELAALTSDAGDATAVCAPMSRAGLPADGPGLSQIIGRVYPLQHYGNMRVAWDGLPGSAGDALERTVGKGRDGRRSIRRITMVRSSARSRTSYRQNKTASGILRVEQLESRLLLSVNPFVQQAKLGACRRAAQPSRSAP